MTQGFERVVREGGNDPDTEAGALVSAFGQHLIGIVLLYRRTGEEKTARPRKASFSSTIIAFGNQVCLLTAGHVIHKIDEHYANKDLIIEQCLLLDNFGHDAKHNNSIPFAWKAADKYAIDEDGLDVGFIRLSPIYLGPLAANGIMPIEEKNWAQQHTVKFDGYVLLGLPDELQDERAHDGWTFMHSVGAPLEKLDQQPDFVTTKTSNPRFFGRVKDGVPVDSVQGMSGGPIVGVRFEGDRVRYWVVAIQSGWYPLNRVVVATPVQHFGKMITDALERVNSPDFDAGSV